MSDQPQERAEFALAALALLSLLFAIAGLVNLLGIVEVELIFFEYSVASRLGNVLWIVMSLSLAVLSGYLLSRRRIKNND